MGFFPPKSSQNWNLWHKITAIPLYQNDGYSLANNPNFDTNAPLFEVRGKVILEGVMHYIRPINLDLRL